MKTNRKAKKTILMAAAECRGVAKVGGLADVVYDLSSELIKSGHRVYVVVPWYPDLPLSVESEVVADVAVSFERDSVPTRVHRSTVAGLLVHRLEAPLFDAQGEGVYVDSGKRGKGPFEDDARRFAFYCAAVWTCLQPGEIFADVEVLHCHDWHTAHLPLLATLDGLAQRFPTVFTIHNLDYQGTRPWDEPYAPGASWRQWFPERWEALRRSGVLETISDPGAPHCFNPMRCGIRLATAVNTVSPSYALEITQADNVAANFLGGRGLESDLAKKQEEGRLWGILNGLDYRTFDPGRLSPPYAADSPDLLSLRRTHRQALWQELPQIVEDLTARHGRRFGNADRVRNHVNVFLAQAAELPLTVCVTRAVSQKLGLFTEDWEGRPVAERFLAQGTALLVLGTGELETRLEPLNDHPSALFLQVFDAELAVRLYAVGELFLMPSDFEPCGISQLMALRYGCLPLVHDRGGLHDTVKDGKTGFVYQGPTRDEAKRAFLKTTSRAVATVKSPKYEALVRAAMGERFEWDRSVAEYEKIYRLVSQA